MATRETEIHTHVNEVDDDSHHERLVFEDAARAARAGRNEALVQSVKDQEDAADDHHGNHRRVLPVTLRIRLE